MYWSRLVECVLLLLASQQANTSCGPQTREAVHFGTGEYIEYREGNIPIIISSPHGGTLKPTFVQGFYKDGGAYVDGACVYDYQAVMTHGSDTVLCGVITRSDYATDDLADIVYQEIKSLTGYSPHFILNKLHRSRLDANRGVGRATFNVPQAVTAWEEFHGFIVQAKDMINGRGLLLDIHAQNKELWVELGYSLLGSQLEDQETNPTPEKSSIRNLASVSNLGFTDLLHGESSLGAFIQKNYEAIPSPVNPTPEGRHYIGAAGGPGGAYITPTHGSKIGGQVDAIQIESPSSNIADTVDREIYGKALANAIVNFYNVHY